MKGPLGYTYCTDCGVNLSGFTGDPERCVDIKATELRQFSPPGATLNGNMMWECRKKHRRRKPRSKHK